MSKIVLFIGIQSTKMDSLKKLRQDKIPLKCEICDKEFKSSESLKYHFNITHNLEEEHQCNICKKVFIIQKQLTSHVKIVHGNKKHRKCDSCGKLFSQAGSLKIHINSVHNGQKDYKCGSKQLGYKAVRYLSHGSSLTSVK